MGGPSSAWNSNDTRVPSRETHCSPGPGRGLSAPSHRQTDVCKAQDLPKPIFSCFIKGILKWNCHLQNTAATARRWRACWARRRPVVPGSAKAPARSPTAALTPRTQMSGQWKKGTSASFYENSFDFMEPSKSSVNSEDTGTSWLRNFQ